MSKKQVSEKVKAVVNKLNRLIQMHIDYIPDPYADDCDSFSKAENDFAVALEDLVKQKVNEEN